MKSHVLICPAGWGHPFMPNAAADSNGLKEE
jgi:hypothetical protein